MSDWQERARRLAGELVDLGALSDPRWRAAFEAVPRHVFVPRFYGSGLALLDGDDPDQREAYLVAVYSDRTLVTQVAPVPGVAGLSWATSSSTRPSLMAR